MWRRRTVVNAVLCLELLIHQSRRRIWRRRVECSAVG
jgi:hypothetical protein